MKAGKNSILINIMPIFAMLIAILPGILYRTPSLEIAKTAILTLILTTAAAFYIRINADIILTKRFAKTVIILSYLGGLVLLLFAPQPYLLCFWMLGGLLVAMLIDNKLGLLLHFNLSFIMGISMDLDPEIVIHILILGVVMSLLAGALRSTGTAIYAMIIILSTNVTLSFVINNFIFDTKENYNYLTSLFSVCGVLVIAYVIGLIYDRLLKKKELPAASEKSAEVTATSREAADPEASPVMIQPTVETMDFDSDIVIEAPEALHSDGTGLQKVIGSGPSYEVLCSEDNELLTRLREFSKNLYAHSIYIGELSARAARVVGADEALSRAGGYYHEIGKITGLSNYIEEGLGLAEDYAFPRELKAILKEHNIKYDKPNSVEAAIVMLSDNVVSTIDYIRSSKDHRFTTNKIIDNIFQMRLEKGTFDGADLSLKDFKALREFYHAEFNPSREGRHA